MRITNLHTICILALGSILAIGIEAHAQLDPNMEASAGCFEANCVFEGNSQVSDNIRGLSKLPVPRLLKVNDYRDNPSVRVNLDETPQFAPVGLLERDTKLADGSIQREAGSAVIVSPCYILTNHHVAFGDDDKPVQGKSYAMTFRAGKGSDEGGFMGHTEATPVLWGKMEANHQNDWALMKLKNCVGTVPSFGWVDAADATAADLITKKPQIAAVGFSYKEARSQMSMSLGVIKNGVAGFGLIGFDASTAKRESGGGLFVMENGTLKLAGLITGGFVDPKNRQAHVSDTWTADRSNFGISASEILNQSDVKAILDADKAWFGKPNPAQERSARPMPRISAQMAAL